MKKLIILLVLMIMLTGVVGAADFRDVNWGMTREQVREIEGTPALAQNGMLAYEVEIFDVKFALGYMFYDNTLTDARYMLMDSSLTGHEYKFLIEDLVKSLTKKYGEPDGGITWLEDTYKYEPGNFDLAVSVGDVFVDYEFDTSKVNVYLGVMGGNYEEDFFIFYNPKDEELAELREQRENNDQAQNEAQL